MQTIGWDDFAKVELRVGRIVDARVFAEARKPAYVLQIDFGDEIGVKKSSAQITGLYKPKELIGKLIVGVLTSGQADRALDVRMPRHRFPRCQRRRRVVCAGQTGAAGRQAGIVFPQFCAFSALYW